MVYRFRVTYEDHEDVYRDIEIKSSQSFLEFHSAIQQAIGFDNSKSAAFYMSDDYWRKEDEISVENTSDEKAKKNKIKKEEHKKKKTIADHIDNPHQRFVYVFDPEKEWTFLIELLKIVPENVASAYPQCVKTVGTAPKQYKPSHLPPPSEEDDNPKKGLPAKDMEREELMPLVLEKDPLDEAAAGFIPLDEEGIQELASEENKEQGNDDENPSDEEEDGESSEGFEFEDDEI